VAVSNTKTLSNLTPMVSLVGSSAISEVKNSLSQPQPMEPVQGCSTTAVTLADDCPLQFYLCYF
jgi:hypothetical protein